MNRYKRKNEIISPLKLKTLRKNLLSRKLSFAFTSAAKFDILENTQTDDVIINQNGLNRFLPKLVNGEITKKQVETNRKVLEVLSKPIDDKYIKQQLNKKFNIIRYNTFNKNNVFSYNSVMREEYSKFSFRNNSDLFANYKNGIDDTFDITDGKFVAVIFDDNKKLYNRRFFVNSMSLIIGEDDDPNEIINETIKLYKEEFKKNGIQLEINVWDDTYTITENKDKHFYHDNKEYFYKFLELSKKHGFKVTENDSLLAKCNYNVAGKVRINKYNVHDFVKKFNKFDSMFEQSKYSKKKTFSKSGTTIQSLHGFKNIDNYSGLRTIHYIYGTNNIKDVKKLFLMFKKGDGNDYSVFMPLDIFKNDLENIKNIIDEEGI